MIGYYAPSELETFGFERLGKNVRISRSAALYNCHHISIGDNVRIDNYCTLAPSGDARIVIGNFVHISAYNFMNGAADLTLEDFVTTAPYVGIFTSTDDYSGRHMTGAVVPRELIGSYSAAVLIEKHCIIGVSSAVMPGVILALGTAVGAHSFIREGTNPLDIVAGVPGKCIGKRKDDFLLLEKKISPA